MTRRPALVLGFAILMLAITIFLLVIFTLPKGAGGETPDCYDEPDCMESPS